MLGRIHRLRHIHQLATLLVLAHNLGGVNSHRLQISDSHQHNSTMPDGGRHHQEVAIQEVVVAIQEEEGAIQEGVVTQLSPGAEVVFMDIRIEDLNHPHKHTIAWVLSAKEIHVCFFRICFRVVH